MIETTLVSIFTIICSTICRLHDRRACAISVSIAVTILNIP